MARVAWAQRGARSGCPKAREHARREVARLLGRARGLMLKAGQIAGMLDVAGEPGYGELCGEAAEALPFDQVRPRLESALGRPWPLVFAAFDRAGRAASLGQVHRAVLLDGREVAVKIRYPGIERAVAAELRLLDGLPDLGPTRAWQMDADGYRRTVRQAVERELDYAGEAVRQRRFAREVDVPGLVVPTVVDHLSTSTVLVQSWEPGESLASAADWSLRERVLLAQTLLRATFQSLFLAGAAHADPHPGNLAVRRTEPRPTLVLYDFGATYELDRERRDCLLAAISASRDGALDRLEMALAGLGFDRRRLTPLRPRLLSLARLLLAPFVGEGPFDLGSWQPGAGMQQLLGNGRWLFRAAAPPDLLLLVRLFAGLRSHLLALDSRLPWWPVLSEVVGRERLAAAAARGVASADADVPLAPGAARHMCVELRSAGAVVFATALPSSAALDLGAWLPQGLWRRLGETGIDVGEIERDCRARGLAPRTLASGGRASRSHRVWLSDEPPEPQLCAAAFGPPSGLPSEVV